MTKYMRFPVLIACLVALTAYTIAQSPQPGNIIGPGPAGATGATGPAPCTTIGAIFLNTATSTPGCVATQLFWDNSNSRLGVGTNTPAQKLDVNGNIVVTGVIAASVTQGSLNLNSGGGANSVAFNYNGGGSGGMAVYGGNTTIAGFLSGNPTGTSYVVGQISSNAFVATGSAPSVSGCGTIGTGSKNGAGFITSGTTGACTPVLTFSSYTATTGWACGMNNATTANLTRQTGYTTTTATFTGTTVSGDVLIYECKAF